jgi:hypothetical protein
MHAASTLLLVAHGCLQQTFAPVKSFCGSGLVRAVGEAIAVLLLFVVVRKLRKTANYTLNCSNSAMMNGECSLLIPISELDRNP